MKKLTAIILAVIISLSCMSVAAFAVGEEKTHSITEFTIGNATLDSKDDVRAVDWWLADNGTYYLFLSQDTAAFVKVWFTATADVMVGSTKLVSGDTTTAFANNLKGTITCAGESYKYEILVDMYCPAIYINTESGSLDNIHANKDNKEAGTAYIKNAGSLLPEYAGELEYIKGRGNSTWEMEKKPYNIKLDKKTDLFGMGKSKKWSLIANHSDLSLIRNYFAYTVANFAGAEYSPKCVPVNLYINNEYQGSYLFTTRIEADDNRVEVDNLDDLNEDANPGVDIEALPRGGAYGTFGGLIEGTSKWVEIPNDPEDITGGYILEMELANRYADEISGFVTTRSQPIIMKCPEFASKNEMEYISSYYQDFEDAVFSEDGKNADGVHFSELCDIDSLAKLYLVNEVSSNLDAFLTSSYFYKPAGGKLYAGPVWDYDIAFGNTDTDRFGIKYNDPTRWTTCHGRQYRNTVFGAQDIWAVPTFMNVLTKNEYFVEHVETVWDGGFYFALKAAIKFFSDTIPNALTNSATMNAVRWNIFNTYDVNEIQTAYKAEVKKVLDFATAKAATIDAGVGSVIVSDIQEDNFFVKGFKKVLTGVNNIFEKAIVLFGLEDKLF